MLRDLIKRYMPDHDTIRRHKCLQIFGRLLHNPNLWHLNRRSASGAFAVGLFIAFVPLPIQMVLAAAAAILFRVNLPLSVTLVWITNPLTIPLMFYGAYWVGAQLLGNNTATQDMEFTLESITIGMATIWEPLLLGCALLGSLSAMVGYLVIRGLWRLHLIRKIKERKKHARKKAQAM